MPLIPDRPVKFVVANTPGGPSDIVARIVTAALEQSTGKTFIVENRGGAGGNIGMEYVAHAEPDGYTILLATNAYSVNYGLYNQLPYDPYKDFVGVSELATSPNTFVVRSELPAKTMKDFVTLARANPEKYNCATPPIGTTSQLQLEAAQDPRKTAKTGRRGVQGRRRRHRGAARRHRAAELRLAAAGIAAHQAWHDALPCGHRRRPLARSAGRADHGGGRLQGLRVRSRLCAAGAGENAARERQMAGGGNAEGAVAPETKASCYKAGFQVRAKGADAAWTRVMKEIDMFKQIIDQAGVPKL